MEKYCCGFGHRFWSYDKQNIEKIVRNLVEQEGVGVFMTGGMGDFDAAFSSAVRSIKVKHKEIRLWLIKPYFSNELNTDQEYYRQMYDEVIIPMELADVHYKAAIGQRNRWMINKCDYVISGVVRDFGGAYTAIKYAEKQGKILIKTNPLSD